jgi:hypothetical protein
MNTAIIPRDLSVLLLTDSIFPMGSLTPGTCLLLCSGIAIYRQVAGVVDWRGCNSLCF